MEKMTQKLLLLLFFILVMVSQSPAQEEPVIGSGWLNTQLSLSPSYLFANQQSHFYLHGSLEAYINPTISLAGEAYYYLGSWDEEKNPFDFNHNLFFGASRHFIKGRNDLYVGIQPGLSFTRLNREKNNLLHNSTGVNPLFSVLGGYNLFVNHLFHFFIQTRILLGNHHYDLPQSLAECRVSFGLGFNINAKKQP